MARRHNAIAPVNQQIQTVIYDPEGNVIRTLGMHEEVVQEPDGSITIRKTSENIVLDDSQVWNPSMMMGNNPRLLCICWFCQRAGPLLHRNHPSRGLISAHLAALCTDCGKTLCARHRKTGKDQELRCKPCSRKYTAKRILQKIFFTYEED